MSRATRPAGPSLVEADESSGDTIGDDAAAHPTVAAPAAPSAAPQLGRAERDRALRLLAAFVDFEEGAERGITPFRDDPRLLAALRSLVAGRSSAGDVSVEIEDGEIAAVSLRVTGPDGVVRSLRGVDPSRSAGPASRTAAAGPATRVSDVLRWIAGPGGSGGVATRWAPSQSAQSRLHRVAAKARRRLDSVRRAVWSTTEFRVVPVDADAAARLDVATPLRRNSIEDLVLFRPAESWQTLRGFLASSRERLRAGHSVYTAADDGLLLHFQWYGPTNGTSLVEETGHRIPLPRRDAVAYDSWTHPAARGRGLHKAGLRHGHRDTAQLADVRSIWGGVLADNVAARRNVESIGARYVCTLRRTRRFFLTFRDACREGGPVGDFERRLQAAFDAAGARSLDLTGIEPFGEGSIRTDDQAARTLVQWEIAHFAQRHLDDRGRAELLRLLAERLA